VNIVQPDSFLTLLDWAYLAVHNGDLDSRDNIGLRAIWDWTREDTAYPALERWILAGNEADLLKRMGYDPDVPLNTKLRDRKGTLDGYQVSIPAEDLVRYDPLLAYQRDGQYIAIRDRGPLFLVYPFDQYPELQKVLFMNRTIWQASTIILQ